MTDDTTTLRADLTAAREEIGRLQGLLREARNTRAADYVPGDWATRVDAALAGKAGDLCGY